DTVGWFARNVEDLALMFETVRVKGADYPIAEAALNDSVRQSAPTARPWRIALMRGPNWPGAERYVRDAVESFAGRIQAPRVKVEEVEAPRELAEAHETHSTIYDRALAYYFKEEF